MMEHGFWWWMPGLGMLAGLLWLVFLVLVVVLLVAALRGRSGGRPSASASAIRLLEERYARGEITREEFLERRDVLLGGSPGS